MKINLISYQGLRVIVILISCLFLCDLSNAQKVQQIKKKAEENKNKKSSSRSSSTSRSRSSSSSYSSDDSDSNGAADFFNGLIALLDLLTPDRSPEERAALRAERALLRQERKLLRAERQLAREELRAAGKLNRMHEFNVGFQYGGIPGLYQSYRPRLHMRIGAISSDLRYSILTEERIEGRDSYETLDWQLLQVNTFNTPEFTWRFGIGFMREQVTETFFPEFLTGMDFYFANRKVRFSPEYRIAYDFHPEADIAPRKEINAELSYGIINQEKFKMYLGVNALYARYYQEVDVWTLGAGIRLNVY